MGIHITAGSMELAIGDCPYAQATIIIGPLHIWLGFNMQGIACRRFDLICEKTDYRPEGIKWFATWQASPEERGGYFLGRQWSLLTGSLVARSL